jgi:hypothetical protein
MNPWLGLNPAKHFPVEYGSNTVVLTGAVLPPEDIVLVKSIFTSAPLPDQPQTRYGDTPEKELGPKPALATIFPLWQVPSLYEHEVGITEGAFGLDKFAVNIKLPPLEFANSIRVCVVLKTPGK